MNTERFWAVQRVAQEALSNNTPLADVIASAIETALNREPSPPAGIPGRWSCGCDSRECRLRCDQMQDAGGDPEAVVRITCVTHALVGRSHPGRVADGLGRLDAQALLNLDLAHQEQCR